MFASHSQAKWRPAQEDEPSETAVFIEPPEGGASRVSPLDHGRDRCPGEAAASPSLSAVSARRRRRRPGDDADAARGLLLPPAHAAAALPLPAHRARAAAAVHGRLPVGAASPPRPPAPRKRRSTPTSHFKLPSAFRRGTRGPDVSRPAVALTFGCFGGGFFQRANKAGAILHVPLDLGVKGFVVSWDSVGF